MLRRASFGHHLLSGLAVAGVTALAGFGVVGAGDQAVFRPEHFDAKQVTVWPVGDDGVRIREVVDIDFGVFERRGYQRIVPTDFGAPTDITASSPDANDDVHTLDLVNDVRIRVGDPNITYTGQRRYILEYTLPDARPSDGRTDDGRLALDIIGTDETFTTDRFEVVLTGFALSDTTCDVGDAGEFGGCTLERDATGNHVTVFEPLDPGEGITVGGAIDGLTDIALPDVPDLPDRNPSGFRPLGLVMLLAGAATAVGVFVWARWYGSNEVVAGGAADAAYGELPTPRAGEPVADVPTYRVPDSRLAELATIEFVPPRGLEPWQGAMLLREEIDDDTVSAWFSEMVAREAITVSRDGDDDDDWVLEPGPERARLHAVDQKHLKSLFRYGDRVPLGKYRKSFTNTWNEIRAEQQRFAGEAGWWDRGAPGGGSRLGKKALSWMFIGVFVFVAFGFSALGAIGVALAGGLSSPIPAVLVGTALVALVAYLAYRSMLPSRTATGSALTLRTESFRRFLTASEGRHVEWAWEHGLLRDYSAWAVALGAADAWSRAVEASNIPHPELALHGPLVVYSAGSAFQSTHTAPTTSSSGGGGFSGGGGGVGGGGGGGSSGSW